MFFFYSPYSWNLHKLLSQMFPNVKVINKHFVLVSFSTPVVFVEAPRPTLGPSVSFAPMSIVALSPVAPEPPSPMILSVTPVTPTVEPDVSNLSAVCMDQSQDSGVSPQCSSRGSLTGVIPQRQTMR